MAPSPKKAPSPRNSSQSPRSHSQPPPRRSPPPPPLSSSSPPPKKGGGGPSPPSPSSSNKGSPPSKSSPPVSKNPPSISAPHPYTRASSNPSPPPTRKVPKSPSHKTPPNPSSSAYSELSKTSDNAIITGLALAGLALLVLVIICVSCSRRRKKKKEAAAYYTKPPPGGKNQRSAPPYEHVIKFTQPGMMGTPVGSGGRWGGSQQSNMSGNNLPLAFSKGHFSYNELSEATGGFAESNLLGQGGFGYVHKGVLPNGKEVAVKSLKSGSRQGEREFQAEVEIISRVHHRHLVSLVGYCIADAQRMLVYEYVPNKTLDFHLHGKGCPVMNWETRLRIALGSAKGLAYLHEDCHPRIIHRDIKSANILLDNKFEAMVADFGLAKLASGDDTHISTRVMGTFGYLAPEYASSGKLTEKSDVFSFGVMLLEILTGRKPIDPTIKQMEDSLVEWAAPVLSKALEDGNFDELIDPRLQGNYEPNEVARMATCAAAGIRHSAKLRPKMSQVVRALECDGSLDMLKDGLKPQRTSSMVSLNQSFDMLASIVYDTKAYNDDMTKFRKMVMSGHESTTTG